MEQRDITLAISRKLPKLDTVNIDKVVEQVFPIIMAALENGHEVNIPKFGKFVTRTLKAHRRKHPFTREEIEVPARTQVKFVPKRRGFTRVLKNRSTDATLPSG